MDAKNAFLNIHLKETIYMKPPLGYQFLDSYVYKLTRAIYVLKQAPRYEKFRDVLLSVGLLMSSNDPLLFTKKMKKGLVI